MEIASKFSSNIRYYAQKKHIKISEIERAAGVEKGYLSRVYAKNKSMQLDVAMRMAQYIGLSIEGVLDYPDVSRKEELEGELSSIIARAEEIRMALKDM